MAITTTDRMRVLSPEHVATEGWWQVVTVRFSEAHLRAMLRQVA